MPDDAAETLAKLPTEQQELLVKVSEILRRIDYGTILLVVQDGKVVQVEMAEKFRLR